MNPDPSSWSPGPFSERATGARKGDGSAGAAEPSSGRRWPDPLAPEALHGLAGDIVRALNPHTEADPVALLGQLLLMFGNATNAAPHFIADGARHSTNLFAVLVGVSSKARKGSAYGHVLQVLKLADDKWATRQIVSGLSSGEGLIWAVRDQIEKRYPVREKGRVVDHYNVVEDPGEQDKRLLVFESEFAGPLQAMSRQGSTLSAVVRQSWDWGDLRALTKNSPARATGAHISIIAHTTRDDLLRYLNATEQANGFGNRFLWFCTRRSKYLPEGGSVPAEQVEKLAERMRAALDFARRAGEVRRDPEAAGLWRQVYRDLAEGKPGLLGAITSRAEAQVMRLAMIYALLDGSNQIRAEHLRAALAVWKYCEASVRYIFGDALGYPEADRILTALRGSPRGLRRTEMQDLFGRHRSEQELDAALAVLAEHGLAQRVTEATNGRPAERWLAI